MEWILRNDDDIFGYNNINSLNLFKEASEHNLFISSKPQMSDYEIQPLDFSIEKETTKSYSKMESPRHQANNNDFYLCNRKKVFEINKINRGNINSISKYNTNENALNMEINEMKPFSSFNNIDHSQFLKLFDKLPLHQRMKIKREKTKFLLKRRQNKEIIMNELEEKIENKDIPYDLKNNSEEETINVENSNNYIQTKIIDKKEKKVLRNRISAQQSRERRKRELQELNNISQGLIDENKILRKELDQKNKQINLLNSKIAKICNECTNNFFSDKRSLTTYSKGNPYVKYGLFTSLLVVVCMIGSCLYDSSSNVIIKLSEGERRYLSTNFGLPSSQESINTKEDNNFLPQRIESNQQLPFNIIGMNQKESLRSNTFFDFPLGIKNDTELFHFLKKKRNGHLANFKQRLYIDKKNLGRNKIDYCLNNNKFFWSIQKESIDFNKHSDDYINNILIQSNDNNNYINDYVSDRVNSSMVSIGDIMIDNTLKENIKSLICQNLIPDSGDFSLNKMLKRKIDNKFIILFIIDLMTVCICIFFYLG